MPVSERPDWGKLQDAAEQSYEDDPKQNEFRRVLREEAEPQKMPLSAYTGEYWNPGYKEMKVDIKDGKLFIDASHRSMGFFLDFDHVREQTEYIMCCTSFQSRDTWLMASKFMFQNDRAIKMGLELDTNAGFIWFDRVEST